MSDSLMSDSLPAISRRAFLSGSLAGLSTALLVPGSFGAEPACDPNRFALFSDTHIAGDPAMVSRGVNMADHFRQAAREVLQCDPRPAAVLVCGDCAYSKGTAEAYHLVRELVEPFRQAGIAFHVALGNHDNRQRFWEIVEGGPPKPSAVPGRHVTVIEAPRARWFLLDSLDESNKTPGVLGKLQLDWLAGALDQRADKPALVMVHHNPDSRPKPSGLVETAELLELLAAHAQVKVLFFGHSHRLSVARHETFHLVNLPAVAYVFAKQQPSGWVDARLRADGLTLTVHCLDKQHPKNGKRVDLDWAS